MSPIEVERQATEEAMEDAEETMGDAEGTVDDVEQTVQTEEAMEDVEDREPERFQVNQQRMRVKVFVAILLNLSLQMITAKIIKNQQAALIMVTNSMHLLHSLQLCRIRLHPHSVYWLERSSPFADQALLSSHSEKEFKRRCRVKKSTFLYICSLVAPVMQKSTNYGGILLETQVACNLNRLGIGNYLLGSADVFGMSEALACIVVREFCNAVLQLIRPLVVPTYEPSALPQLAKSFEEKHGIPFIMGAIDGSHIPIIAPIGDPTPFYNRKGFYSVLLQGIVDMKTIFWDWDFGWAGSLHDYTLFMNSHIGQEVLGGKYLPYKLIGDAAYSSRTCMYVPFKGTKEGLEPAKAHWKIIQSFTRMCVERAFGVLKGRWRILLRRCEMNLNNLSPIVGSCICLHNLCIMQKDFADERLVQESKRWLLESNIEGFGDLRQAGTMAILDYSKAEVSRVDIGVNELIQQASLPNTDGEHFDAPTQSDTANVSALKAEVTMHTHLASNLFNRHLRDSVQLPPGYFEEDSASADDE